MSHPAPKLTLVESLTDKALDAFWQVIVEALPQATTGDLSPGTTIAFDMAAKDAVSEWISYNVSTQQKHIAVNYRFRLLRPVARSPDFCVPSGRTGVVTALDADGVWGRIDEQIAGAEHWDNQIHWPTSDEFAHDTMPA